MKRRILYIVAFLSVLSFVDAGAQNVIMNASLDTIQMRIGEQTRIRTELSVDTGFGVPQFSVENIPGKIEVLKTDNKVNVLNQGRRMQYINEYLITSFDSTTYIVPPFKAQLAGKEYLSNELVLAVYSVPVDTTNIQNIAPPKKVWERELTWEEIRDAIYLGFLVIFFVALLAWVAVRLAKNKPVIRIIKIKPRLPSHVNAMKKIDEVKNDKSWRVDGDNKRYYTRLTDILREYLYERYGVNAAEMTTPEIVEHMNNVADKERISELREILEMADLVKFAKLAPAMNENDHNLMAAVEFIEKTKNVEEETRPQPTEKKIISKRSVRQKWALIISVVVLALLLVAVAVFLYFDLSNLFG